MAAAPIQVAQPPPRPLLVFDNDCNFCRFWVRRWEQLTGGQIDTIASQDPSVPARFPEIPSAHFEAAVQLIETDGRVFSGAEAVFRSLSRNPDLGWVLWVYSRVPGAAPITERTYSFVARHRQGFSRATRLLWGTDPAPPDYQLIRRLFLRGLGLIYLAAFLSLWVQIDGLIGSHGILPANQYMAAARQFFNQEPMAGSRYHLLPTLCWFSGNDGFLHGLCAGGTVASILLVAGVAPTWSAALLWTIYLSLTVVARDFLSFQWDALLLEVGFLAIFLAPLRWWPKPGFQLPVPRSILWLLRWLLFRLMFESGCVKLLSGDPTWRQLTALKYHYETQPLPTWMAWYAHRWPGWFQETCVAVLFGIELILPFFVFGPRRLRFVAGGGFVILQTLILLTGNYAFFNYLTILLCLVLLDDGVLQALKLRRPSQDSIPATSSLTLSGTSSQLEGEVSETLSMRLVSSSEPPVRHRPLLTWPIWLTAPLMAVILLVSIGQFTSMFGSAAGFWRPLRAVGEWLAPFRTINSYGLFAVMTTTRPEIIVEGSNDRTTWKAYEFKYKPGPLQCAPAFVAPHQPRLDWQMWFAALGTPQQNPWFLSFCMRLLQGSPEVLRLLAANPFPDHPPRYVRAVMYEYHFSTAAERRTEGVWWRRTPQGLYIPAISLEDLRPARLRAR